MKKKVSIPKTKVDSLTKKVESKINLSDLSPHLENFMMEILEKISVKVNKLPPDENLTK
jgi:hypothetical protein